MEQRCGGLLSDGFADASRNTDSLSLGAGISYMPAQREIEEARAAALFSTAPYDLGPSISERYDASELRTTMPRVTRADSGARQPEPPTPASSTSSLAERR